MVLSRVAALVKVKCDAIKTRLIHDLRRSKVNRLAAMLERVILPRLIDAVASMLQVLRTNSTPDDIELAVLDFKHAFKQMFVALEEQRFLAGRADTDG